MNALVQAIGLIIIVASAAVYAIMRILRSRDSYTDSERQKKKVSKAPLFVSIIGVAVFFFGNCFMVVPTGYTGVRTTFGLIDNESCKPGFNVVTPFVQTISLVNNKQQDIRFNDRIWSETKEQTVVFMEGVSVSYQINPESSAWIYANVENWVEELIDFDIVSSASKTASRAQTADVVTDRSVIEPAVKEQLQQTLDDKYGEGRVAVKTVIINNIDFEDSYNQAIAEKSNAIQRQQRQAIENQTNIDKAKAEADAARECARGDADAERIRAEGKAEANRTIANSLSEATQRQDAIEKWNGELPRYVGGDSEASFGILDTVGQSTSDNAISGTAPSGSSASSGSASGGDASTSAVPNN